MADHSGTLPADWFELIVVLLVGLPARSKFELIDQSAEPPEPTVFLVWQLAGPL